MYRSNAKSDGDFPPRVGCCVLGGETLLLFVLVVDRVSCMRRMLVGVFFLVGFPNLFGFFFGACVRVALLCANPFGSTKVRVAVSEIVGGVATAFAVVLIANLLGLRSTAWLAAV